MCQQEREKLLAIAKEMCPHPSAPGQYVSFLPQGTIGILVKTNHLRIHTIVPIPSCCENAPIKT
jgi:hypothetical protein